MADFEHTGPGTPAGTFMRQFWQPVQRSADIANGRAKPIRIMGEDFTLFRGADGEAHVIGFRCAHRGSQLSTGWVEGNTLRCLYHGWSYDGSGLCVEAPAERSGFGGTVHVPAYPTREHVGLIFVYLGTGALPPFPHIPAFDGEGIIETWVEPFPCNFFQCWENSWDEYHVHFTHSTGGMHRTFAEVPKWEMEETEWGILRRSLASDGTSRTSPFIMPNIMRTTVPSPNALQGHGPRSRSSYLIKVPVDDDSHLFYGAQFIEVTGAEVAPYRQAYERYLQQRAEARPTDEVARDILAGRLSLADVRDHPYLAIIEDQVAQVGQGAIADRNAEHLGRSDAGIAYMRRIWAREIQATTEGRPIKKWSPLTTWGKRAEQYA